MWILGLKGLIESSGALSSVQMLGQQCWELLRLSWQWCADATTPNNVGTYSASWEGYNT